MDNIANQLVCLNVASIRCRVMVEDDVECPVIKNTGFPQNALALAGACLLPGRDGSSCVLSSYWLGLER